MVNILDQLKLIKNNVQARKSNIEVLLNFIWLEFDENVCKNENYQYLLDLADDLNNYEPNPNWRVQDASYYGDEKLEAIIDDAIKKFEKGD